MKYYILVVYSTGCEPLQNEINPSTTFTDFDKAWETMCAAIHEEWPLLELPQQPKRPQPYRFAHKGDYLEIWVSDAPPNSGIIDN